MEHDEFPTIEEMTETWLESCRTFAGIPETDFENKFTDVTLALRSLILDLYVQGLMGPLPQETIRRLSDRIEDAIYDLRLPAHPTRQTIVLHNHMMTARLDALENARDVNRDCKDADSRILA